MIHYLVQVMKLFIFFVEQLQAIKLIISIQLLYYKLNLRMKVILQWAIYENGA